MTESGQKTHKYSTLCSTCWPALGMIKGWRTFRKIWKTVILVDWLFQDLYAFLTVLQAISLFSVSGLLPSVLFLVRVILRLWNISYLPQCTLTQRWIRAMGCVFGCYTGTSRDQDLRLWLNPFRQRPNGRCQLLNPSTAHKTFIHTVATKTKAVCKLHVL